MPPEDQLSATITLQPAITVGQVTTVAEKVLDTLFKDYETVLESENPIKDPKQFFHMRGMVVKMLVSPIKAVRDTKTPLSLKFSFDMETGVMKMSAVRK